MRTKTLLCMAALAAGVATSMAQNVYSLNIVGYANVPNGLGYSFQTSPFQVTTAVTNGANEILPDNTAGTYDGDQVLLWTGSGWAPSYRDSAQIPGSGFSDSGGSPIPAPILSSGLGYLYYNAQAASNNLTYVGQVRTGTNTVSMPQFPLKPQYSAVACPTPFAGGVISSLQFSNNIGDIDGDAVMLLVTLGGVPKGFAASFFDSSQNPPVGSGFSDSGGAPIPEPQIPVGGGFLYNHTLPGSVTWKVVFNP